jgi:hypothetical protein
MSSRLALFTLFVLVSSVGRASAQEPNQTDTRTQYPAFMTNSYFTLNLGSIRYIFSNDQLAPGFKSESVDIPHLGARVDLFGHHFTRHLSAQVTYMRPAQFVAYHNVNGDQAVRQVTTAYGGFTMVWDTTMNEHLSAYVEGGVGVTSRSGFVIDGTTVLQDAHFAAGIVGAGLAYHASPTIDLMFGATYSPGRKGLSQPSTRMYTTGMRFHMRPLPEASVEANRREGFVFPQNIVRLGYTTNLGGYSLNDFFSQTVPIFWGGKVDTRRGVTLDYERNMFHTKNRFAFDLGASASYWKSDGNRELFRTASVYPLFRFFLGRTDAADLYLAYSLAGPTYISQTVIDGRDTGARFTFQDFMGFGAFIGRSRRFNAELGIKHYSNGNIFTRNASIKVPVTLSLGLAF